MHELKLNVCLTVIYIFIFLKEEIYIYIYIKDLLHLLHFLYINKIYYVFIS